SATRRSPGAVSRGTATRIGADGTRRDLRPGREPVAVSGLAPYAAAMGVCDPDLGGHAARVGVFADTIARRLGWSGEQLEDVRLGAALHDGGKIAVRQDILHQTGAADAFDAMSSGRPYRNWLAAEAALEEVARCAGSQFDPLVAETFLEAWSDGEIVTGSPLAATG